MKILKRMYFMLGDDPWARRIFAFLFCLIIAELLMLLVFQLTGNFSSADSVTPAERSFYFPHGIW